MAGLASVPFSGDEETVSVEEKIRRRAHEIYLSRGENEGSAEEDWFRAEAEIREQEQREQAPPSRRRARA